MTDPALVPEHSVARGTDEEAASPRSDLKDAVGWIVFGLAVLVGSLTMDRLEQQNINPVTVPGLLPGLLGIAMILLGAIMAVRSWRRGALATRLPPATAHQREERKRVAIAVALCCGYGIVLVGHGIPFWLASTLYVTASILIFQRMAEDPAERRLTARAWAKAFVIAVVASVITWLVFERVFLVRLP
ncbi:tripartite tricarboxylate transporter TctB family protein [Ramlibacter alkalitolerans]|uniref:Tripartite tricarboxylate transporter TctB family protein n=1 Tax=Ramlibacter alkalitolerans TaxID=2039631 RepID=A0ABS1JN85_9BURK|nr:tripartite tricarboxylate transporter TctB family protein [Ramlibacter alkalitolerans]MBL0425712.1 tripartite tricarboxylate transporter TctB family protein [Ramlibacter alkalitolerans]